MCLEKCVSNDSKMLSVTSIANWHWMKKFLSAEYFLVSIFLNFEYRKNSLPERFSHLGIFNTVWMDWVLEFYSVTGVTSEAIIFVSKISQTHVKTVSSFLLNYFCSTSLILVLVLRCDLTPMYLIKIAE